MDIEELTHCAKLGYSGKEISEKLNANYYTVMHKAKELGIKISTKKTIVDDSILKQINDYVSLGMTNTQIAKKLHISPTTVRKYTLILGKNTNSVKKKPIKSVNLSDVQMEVIYGGMLGDMSITKTKTMARLSISQGGSHELYFDHLCDIFKNLLGKISKIPRYDNRTKIYYNKFSVRSLAHATYLNLYNIFYTNGKKTITESWINKITPRSIAYWFMDDGGKRGIFATNCFTNNEVMLLQKMFKNKFDISTRTYKIPNKEQYLLIVLKEDLIKFENLIRPYIHESMKYKLIDP